MSVSYTHLFADKLFNECHVKVIPGIAFGDSGTYHFILKSIFNFYQSECHLFHSVKRLFQVLHAYGAGNSEMICAAIAKGNPRNDLYMAFVKEFISKLCPCQTAFFNRRVYIECSADRQNIYKRHF